MSMFGRRMLWTTFFGAVVALVARMINRRQSPVRRGFRRLRRGRGLQWARPLLQIGRRIAR